MRQGTVTVQRPKKQGPMTGDDRHGCSFAARMCLARRFDVEQPDPVWVRRYHLSCRRPEGSLYLAVLLDLCSR